MSEKKQSIGALWEKTSGKGNKFFSGNIEWKGEKISIVVFPNNFKESEKHPDHKIYESEPRESKPKDISNWKDEDDGESIPF